MTKKNAISLLMSGALMASMVTPAFALGGGSKPAANGGGSTTGSSTATSVTKSMDYQTLINMPTIDIEMTSNNSVIVNPYRLSYVVDPTDTTADPSTDSIITSTNFITSKSNAPISVGVTINSTAPEGVDWATALIGDKNTPDQRQVALALQLKAVTDITEEPTWDEAASTNTGSFGSAKTAADAVEAAADDATAADIFLSNEAQSLGTEEGSYYYVMKPAAEDTPTYAAFHLVGDCSQTSGTAAWTGAEQIKVSTAFTFTMLPNVIE